MRAEGSRNAVVAGADVDLVRPRSISACVDCDGGFGFDVTFSCGHAVWCAVRPAGPVQCAVCLDKLIRQIQELQCYINQMPI